MDVIFMTNYSFSEMRRHINSEILLITDFMNLKIKLAQFFGSAHMNKLYVRVFIGLSVCTYINIYVYPVFIKKTFSFFFFFRKLIGHAAADLSVTNVRHILGSVATQSQINLSAVLTSFSAA
jgi:hypothetical protein